MMITRTLVRLTFVLGLFFDPPSFAADITLHDNAEGSPAIPLIESAKKSLDVEAYQMDSPAVQSAILEAAKNGIKVRVLIEPTPVGTRCDIFSNSSTASDDPLLSFDDTCSALKVFKTRLEGFGGTFQAFSKTLCGVGSGSSNFAGCVQHGKMFIADREEAILSTGNFNSTSLCDLKEKPSRCNRDFTVAIKTPAVVRNLVSVFELDWIGIPYNLPESLPRDVFSTLTISPFSMAPITNFIRSAKVTVEIEEQYLNDPTMNAALVETAARGVDVKILVASYCAFGKPSASVIKRAKVNNGAFEGAGAEVMTFPSAIRINGKPGYLHSKAIVVDGNRAWVGSENGSTQSLTRNREFGIFFNDAVAVEKLRTSFLTDFRNPEAQTWQDSLECRNDVIDLD